MGADPKKAGDAMALLEEATNSRSMLARDEYDSRRWRDEVADAREDIANSRSVVISAISGVPSTTVAENQPVPEKTAPTAASAAPASAAASSAPISLEAVRPASDPIVVGSRPRQAETSAAAPPPAKPVAKPSPEAKRDQAAAKSSEKNEPAEPAPKAEPPVETGPLSVGALTDYATNRPAPIYPSFARTAHAQGVVRVDVIVDEDGEVASIEKTSGPSLLQGAAKDAIRKWRFKPFERNGQPVKAVGFVTFNFSL